ncbi:Gibberellin receptor GID1A [Camellia lanceoleosa]|nr:Gibberellin receptor GID1A [Camellia lanceoleosa]
MGVKHNSCGLLVSLSFHGGHAYLSTSVLSYSTPVVYPTSSSASSATLTSNLHPPPNPSMESPPPTSTSTLPAISGSASTSPPPPPPPPPPLLIYFHGGGFITSAANSKIYEHLCRNLAAQLQVTVASINYRRSQPPLPFPIRRWF